MFLPGKIVMLLRHFGAAAAAAMLIGSLPVAMAAAPPAKTAKTPPSPASAVSQAQIQRIMSFLESTEPEVYAKAVVLRRSAPKKFVRLITEAAPNFRRLEHLQKQDPQLFALTIQDIKLTHHSFTIAGELRQPNIPNEQLANLRQELQQVVRQQFDLRQKIRQLELDRLTKRLDALKAQFAQREKDRRDIIQSRVNNLIGKPPSVNW